MNLNESSSDGGEKWRKWVKQRRAVSSARGYWFIATFCARFREGEIRTLSGEISPVLLTISLEADAAALALAGARTHPRAAAAARARRRQPSRSRGGLAGTSGRRPRHGTAQPMPRRPATALARAQARQTRLVAGAPPAAAKGRATAQLSLPAPRRRPRSRAGPLPPAYLTLASLPASQLEDEPQSRSTAVQKQERLKRC
jgi:hypothetical protein